MSPEAPAAVAKVLESGYIGQGPKVDEFERRLSEVFGGEVLTTNSCTSALDLALHLAGVGSGDEVISTAMTCTATNGVIVNRHAKIVWADVDPLTGCIVPTDVANKFTDKTKAVIAVDWAGRDYGHIELRKSTSSSVPIIEDAAHAFDNQQRTRLTNEMIAWSFQAIKHLTTGDGGALYVPEELRERARLLRWYGLDRTKGDSFRCQQTIHEAGYKYHMNDIAAAIGLANLPIALANIEKHRDNARWYHSALKYCQGAGRLILPPPDENSSWWLYTLLVEDRDRFITDMRELGVECSPVHARNDKHPAFRGWGAPLPGLDYFAAREVAIPVGWWLSEKDREHVAEAVVECSKKQPAIADPPRSTR